MQTNIPVGSSLAKKHFGVALFAVIQRANTLMKNLTGPAPKQSQAEMKLRGQSSPDMPVVRVTDLAKNSGDTVTMDLFNVIGGKVLVGDVNAEGKGEKLTWSSQEASIQMLTKVVDAGGKMAQQRTVHDLRGIAMANLMGYFPRLENQQCLVHLAGARGNQAGLDWVVPTASDPDYQGIMVNPVKAPTYNRHYVADNGSVVQGGQELANITGTQDTPKLSMIDELRKIIDDMEYPLQPIKISDDPAAEDEPLYLMLMSPRAYAHLLQDTTSNANIRSFQQNAWNRASYGSKHPLFRGEVGLWNGILVKKMSRAIRFAASENVPIITAANRYTATESNQAVNGSIGSGYHVERCLLLGAQALANVYGKNQGSDWYASYGERLYNFERNYEAMGEVMNGKAKVRFNVDDGQGNKEPTDLGVMVLDVAVKS